ncbi:MAG: hypothetical protein WBP12_01700 [Candidatus Saccharimonas sp.]
MESFHTDHHLQSRILDTLHHHGVQSFSELKPDEIENSLFMYHMRKLISREIVEKTADGYRLTPSGARWVNQTDIYQRARQLPRPMVQLLVLHEDHLLVSRRAEHMAEHMNSYMLPGGLHRFGETSKQNAERIAEKFGLQLKGERLAQTEVIVRETHHHSLVDIYLASAPGLDYSFDDDLFTVQFMPITEILTLPPNEATTLPAVLRSYLNEGTLQASYVL